MRGGIGGEGEGKGVRSDALGRPRLLRLLPYPAYGTFRGPSREEGKERPAAHS